VRRGLVWTLAAAVLGLTVLAALGARSGAAGTSSLSRGARGLLAARLYLERRGCAVDLLDRPWEPPLDRPPGVLVLALPWPGFGFDEGLAGLDRHLLRGGSIVLLYSGDRPAIAEADVLARLHLSVDVVRGDPPLAPRAWHRFMTEEWTLTSESGGRPLRVGAPRALPGLPTGAAVLYRGPQGHPVVFEEARAAGRIVAAPVDVLANARLDAEGNADFLETLRVRLGDRWTIDERHHGLAAPVTPVERASLRLVDQTLAHLLFLYVLALLALGRRFGPAWTDPPVASGSAASFMIGLGGLHHRLGHHAEAARSLRARALELDPHLRLPQGGGETGADGLLRVAREVGRAQQRNGRRT
jgi:hypothetical protein